MHLCGQCCLMVKYRIKKNCVSKDRVITVVICNNTLQNRDFPSQDNLVSIFPSVFAVFFMSFYQHLLMWTCFYQNFIWHTESWHSLTNRCKMSKILLYLLFYLLAMSGRVTTFGVGQSFFYPKNAVTAPSLQSPLWHNRPVTSLVLYNSSPAFV